MCEIPDQVRPIVDAYCKTVLRRTCAKLPCALVETSSATSERIRCQANGLPINDEIGNSTNAIECIKSPALALFTNGLIYPSLRTNGYTAMTQELFSDILFVKYRSPESVWGLSFNWESIGNYPWAGDKALLSLFDVTEGYDRRMYHVITDSYFSYDLPSIVNETRLSFDSAIRSKKEVPAYVTSSILWLNSNCQTASNRTGYMTEMMRHISVDAWGRCGRNKGHSFPPEIMKIQKTSPNVSFYHGHWGKAKKALLKHYPFTVAIENTLTYDYVTEKLWQPLAAGSVPLYYGAPNIEDWLPCKNCIVNLRQFANPRAAAEFIESVSRNLTRYAEFHKWRSEPIPEKFQKIINYFQRAKRYKLDHVICAMAHSDDPQTTREEILNQIGPIFGTS